ncbi:hypothetical protein D3C76_758210 [compost metagenome]
MKIPIRELESYEVPRLVKTWNKGKKMDPIWLIRSAFSSLRFYRTCFTQYV